MVSPVLFVAIPLATAFLLPLVTSGRRGSGRARAVQAVVLAAVLAGVAYLVPPLLRGGAPIEVTTGGWPPPLGINLRFGPAEAALLALAAATALGAALRGAARVGRGDRPSSSRGRGRDLDDDAVAAGTADRAPVLELLMFVGAAGLIMTRDIFNTFVFLEIASISTYALAVAGRERSGLEAGFKYMFLGAVSSALMLMAIAVLYRLTGTLNIDGMSEALLRISTPAFPVPALQVALAFLLVAFFVELKVFPLNGPALDMYAGVEPGVMALVGGTTLMAAVFAFWKVLPFFHGAAWSTVVMAVGALSFLVGNGFGTRQRSVRRMLGYSTSAQVGLVVMLLPLVVRGVVGPEIPVILLASHVLGKTGVLWLVGRHGGETLDDWRGAFAGSPLARFSLTTLVLTLACLPPFPGFWGKWYALSSLSRTGHVWLVAAVLLGSFFEFVYMFGWLRRVHSPAPEADSAGQATRNATDIERATNDEPELEAAGPDDRPVVFVHVFAFASLAIGFLMMRGQALLPPAPVMLLAGAGLALLALRALPGRAREALVLLTVVGVGWMLSSSGLLSLADVRGLFTAVVLLGGTLAALSSYAVPAPGRSYDGLFLILMSSLVMLVRAESLLIFFLAWEAMTWTSYLLVAGGRRGAAPAYSYMLFSGAAGFLVMGGLMIAAGRGITSITDVSMLTGSAAAWAAVLLGAGFAIKAASAGAHIWAPGAYAEAPDVFSAFISGVLSKMPLFGIVVFAARLVAGPGVPRFWGVEPSYVLAWLGAITAFGMTLLAALQEDAKRLLAYSSVGQIGYAVVGLALFTPLGWTAALYHVVNHFLIKMLLFLAVAGVVYRTGTTDMHRMGGLIKKMPASYISVLIGIIALSGVPPLSGFAGKWLLYSALLEKGWYFVAGLSMFASVIAFLYLFRLIHSIFLGQLKPEHRNVKEAPLPIVTAQAILVLGIMGISAFPQAVLRPVAGIVERALGSPGILLAADGSLQVGYGYLNAFAVMALVMVLFAIFFAFLLFLGPKTRKVKQLDIVYAGEMPPAPQEIHHAYDFYRPYKRAFSPLLRVSAGRGWGRTSAWAGRAAEVGRRMYTGDGQSYLVYALAFAVLLAVVRVWFLR